MSFTLTEQADLNLPAITSSSAIDVDETPYPPTLATSMHQNRPFCVLYDDRDVEWLMPAQANKAVRFKTQMRLLQDVNNNADLIDFLGLTADANYGAVRSAFCSVRNEIHPDIFQHDAADTAFRKFGAAYDNWRASRSPSQGSPAPVHGRWCHTSATRTAKASISEFPSSTGVRPSTGGGPGIGVPAYRGQYLWALHSLAYSIRPCSRLDLSS